MPRDDLGKLLGPMIGLKNLAADFVPVLVLNLGCGSVTVEVERPSSFVTWRNFGYQNDYEPFEQSGIFPHLGPFTFDRVEYDAVPQQFRDGFEAQRGVG